MILCQLLKVSLGRPVEAELLKASDPLLFVQFPVNFRRIHLVRQVVLGIQDGLSTRVYHGLSALLVVLGFSGLVHLRDSSLVFVKKVGLQVLLQVVLKLVDGAARLVKCFEPLLRRLCPLLVPLLLLDSQQRVNLVTLESKHLLHFFIVVQEDLLIELLLIVLGVLDQLLQLELGLSVQLGDTIKVLVNGLPEIDDLLDAPLVASCVCLQDLGLGLSEVPLQVVELLQALLDFLIKLPDGLSFIPLDVTRGVGCVMFVIQTNLNFFNVDALVSRHSYLLIINYPN